MTQTFITSQNIILRIQVLESRLNKEEKKLKIIKFFRKNKIKNIRERLQINWDKLYEFYPDLCGIKKISTFSDLINSGCIPNKWRMETYNSKIYVVGSDEYNELMKEKGMH